MGETTRLQALESDCPLVSVIVGSYNHEHYVRECLDSLIHSSYPNFEIIVFDDKSADQSPEVIRQWIADHPEQRIIFDHHDVNIGLTRSLNRAITQAHGEFCCLIAADDAMLPNGIDDRVTYLLQHPEKLAVFADCHVIDAQGVRIFDSLIEGLYKHAGMEKRFLQIEELIPDTLIFNWGVAGPVFMCRMTMFSEIGLYDEDLYAEDFDMYLRVAAEKKLGFVDSYIANYRRHSEGMTLSQSTRVARAARAAAEKNRHRSKDSDQAAIEKHARNAT